MRTTNRKKALRRVNKVARLINDGIKRDNLWRGRFYMRQSYFAAWPYEDGSGLYGRVIYEFVDLKTGFKKEKIFDLIDFESLFCSKIWWAMNDFIVEDCKIWEREERESLYGDTKIYR